MSSAGQESDETVAWAWSSFPEPLGRPPRQMAGGALAFPESPGRYGGAGIYNRGNADGTDEMELSAVFGKQYPIFALISTSDGPLLAPNSAKEFAPREIRVAVRLQTKTQERLNPRLFARPSRAPGNPATDLSAVSTNGTSSRPSTTHRANTAMHELRQRAPYQQLHQTARAPWGHGACNPDSRALYQGIRV